MTLPSKKGNQADQVNKFSKTRLKINKNSHEKLQHGSLHKIQMNLNISRNFKDSKQCWYRGNNFEQYLTNSLVRFLNKCERGLSAKYNSKKKEEWKEKESSEFFVRAQTWKRLEK